MATTHRNRLVTAISNTPGASGDLTIAAAASGYRTFGAADDGLSFDVSIVDGTDWETRTGCVYTHSGTSLSRGTLEDSSSVGPTAISLTSAAIVTATLTSAFARRMESAALTQVTGTDANTTMAVGCLYVVDMSAWATSDRTYKTPAVAAVGDRVGVMVSAGDASHELILTADTGDTLNGVAGGTEWSRVFITGEVVIMRCVAANATWMVEYDGRIPAQVKVRNDGTTTQSFAATGFTKFQAALDAEDVDNSSSWDNSTGTFTARRAGNYNINGAAQWATVAASTSFILLFYKNGADYSHVARGYTGASAGNLGMGGGDKIPLAVGDTLEMYGYNSHASTAYNTVAGAPRVSFSVSESL